MPDREEGPLQSAVRGVTDCRAEMRTRRYRRTSMKGEQPPLRSGSHLEELEAPGNALQLMFAAFLKLEAGPCHEIDDGP